MSSRRRPAPEHALEPAAWRRTREENISPGSPYRRRIALRAMTTARSFNVNVRPRRDGPAAQPRWPARPALMTGTRCRRPPTVRRWWCASRAASATRQVAGVAAAATHDHAEVLGRTGSRGDHPGRRHRERPARAQPLREQRGEQVSATLAVQSTEPHRRACSSVIAARVRRARVGRRATSRHRAAGERPLERAPNRCQASTRRAHRSGTRSPEHQPESATRGPPGPVARYRARAAASARCARRFQPAASAISTGAAPRSTPGMRACIVAERRPAPFEGATRPPTSRISARRGRTNQRIRDRTGLRQASLRTWRGRRSGSGGGFGPALSAAATPSPRRPRGRSACVDVDHDAVTIVHERDRAAVDRLGRHVADAEAPRPPGEAAIGDRARVGAPPGTFSAPVTPASRACPAHPWAPRSG